ncbi:hypothetical protein MASR2M48_09830 [Spirochaetota bacterium]
MDFLGARGLNAKQGLDPLSSGTFGKRREIEGAIVIAQGHEFQAALPSQSS